MRAKIIENRLNLDLTNDISLLYDLNRWRTAVQFLYVGFVFLTVGVGYPILLPRLDLFAWVVIAGVWAVLLIHFISKSGQRTLVDWSVDRKIVVQGNPVRITFTNLNARPVEGRNYKFRWKISELTPRGEYQYEPKSLAKPVQLRHLESYDWLWPTKKTDLADSPDPALYELRTWAEEIGEVVIGLPDDDELPQRPPDSRIIIQLSPAPPEDVTAILRLRIQKSDGGLQE